MRRLEVEVLPEPRLDAALQAPELGRQIRRRRAKLVDEHRDRVHQDQPEDRGDAQHHQGRGERSRHPAGLEQIDERVEGVRDQECEEERDEDPAQDVRDAQ